MLGGGRWPGWLWASSPRPRGPVLFNPTGPVVSMSRRVFSRRWERDQSNTYDPVRNRLPGGPTSSVTTYAPNALNQCTATTSPTEPFTYDDDGNLVQDSTWTYTWDAENRLVRAENVGGGSTRRLDFAYDYLGRRVQKKVYSSADAGQTWTSEADHRFVYDGWSVVLILDGTNGNSVLQRFTHGLDLSQSIGGAGGVGGLLAVQNVGSSLPAKTYYYAHDANGNVTQLIDGADGSVAAHYEYGPFGEAVVVTEDADVAQSFAHGGFRFSGKLLDSETGLYYYGYRYYDPGHGRWLNRDPLEEQGGINLYGFVGNDPINAIDPLGLTDVKIYLSAQDVPGANVRGGANEVWMDLRLHGKRVRVPRPNWQGAYDYYEYAVRRWSDAINEFARQKAVDFRIQFSRQTPSKKGMRSDVGDYDYICHWGHGRRPKRVEEGGKSVRRSYVQFAGGKWRSYVKVFRGLSPDDPDCKARHFFSASCFDGHLDRRFYGGENTSLSSPSGSGVLGWSYSPMIERNLFRRVYQLFAEEAGEGEDLPDFRAGILGKEEFYQALYQQRLDQAVADGDLEGLRRWVRHRLLELYSPQGTRATLNADLEDALRKIR